MIACILAGTHSVTKSKECGLMLTQAKEREITEFQPAKFGSKPSGRLEYGDLATSAAVCRLQIC